MTSKIKRIIANVLSFAVGIAVGVAACVIIDGSNVDNNGGGLLISENASNGVSIKARKLSTTAATVASTEPHTTYILTAVISPSNVNAQLDWSVSFVDAASNWANGKAISDYMLITPTSDGALTAYAECLQPFGEQIEIKAQVRDDEDVFGTCKADYRQKVTGSSFYLECADPTNDEESLVIWNFNQSSSDTYVDFIPTLVEYGSTFDDIWTQTTYLHASASSIKSEGTLTSEIQNYTISVAPTQEYLNAFEFGGYTVTSSPEVFKNLITGAPDSDLRIAFTDILFTNFVSDLNNTTADMLNNFLSYLHEYSNSVMLRMKVSCTALEGSNTVTYNTVYNVMFIDYSTVPVITISLEDLEY